MILDSFYKRRLRNFSSQQDLIYNYTKQGLEKYLVNVIKSIPNGIIIDDGVTYRDLFVNNIDKINILDEATFNLLRYRDILFANPLPSLHEYSEIYCIFKDIVFQDNLLELLQEPESLSDWGYKHTSYWSITGKDKLKDDLRSLYKCLSNFEVTNQSGEALLNGTYRNGWVILPAFSTFEAVSLLTLLTKQSVTQNIINLVPLASYSFLDSSKQHCIGLVSPSLTKRKWWLHKDYENSVKYWSLKDNYYLTKDNLSKREHVRLSLCNVIISDLSILNSIGCGKTSSSSKDTSSIFKHSPVIVENAGNKLIKLKSILFNRYPKVNLRYTPWRDLLISKELSGTQLID